MNDLLPIILMVVFFGGAIALWVLKKPKINIVFAACFLVYSLIRYFAFTHDNFELIMSGFMVLAIVMSYMEIQKQNRTIASP